MKIWLPDQLYRAKPLVLILLAAVLFLVSESIYLSVLAALFMGYAMYIIVMRIIWMDRTVVSSNLIPADLWQYEPSPEDSNT